MVFVAKKQSKKIKILLNFSLIKFFINRNIYLSLRIQLKIDDNKLENSEMVRIIRIFLKRLALNKFMIY
ncbi:hypothetical protein GCM10008903_18750 [Clostridium cadaveris]